jgi:hypothetical protein
MCLLAHIIDKAHVVFVKISQLLHLYFLVVTLTVFRIGVMRANGMVFDVIVNIILNNLVNYLLFLILVSLLHQTLSFCRSHHVSLESRRLDVDFVRFCNDAVDLV